MQTNPPPPPKVAPTSAPGVHEVATFLPGRLEFEHELDNEAEDLVKDLEFGICLKWDGDKIPEDENDADVKARARWTEDQKNGIVAGKGTLNASPNGVVNGYHSNQGSPKRDPQPRSEDDKADNDAGDGEGAEEVTQPPPFETEESLQFKLTLLEMYGQRIEKRHENKALMFDRGLLSYKQVSILHLK